MTDVHRVSTSTMASRRLHLVVALLACLASCSLAADDGYYGKHLGKLRELHHGVSGDVYAVDARTLHIRDFTYDGEGPAAYFYVGSSKTPSGAGTRINDEKGSPNVLPRYRKKHITLTLPEGKTLTSIKWLAVWCDEFSVNFGDVRVPKAFAFPKPQKLDALKGIHGVSSEHVVVVDAQTLLVPSFSYDGEAPDAKFWVGPGPKPNPQGIRIPDENGKKEHPLRRYDQKTIVLTLPGDMTVFDIGHFGVWCEAFAVDFAHITIPKTINVPPSLKMLGVSPQSKLNCEVLWDDLAFEVRWAVAGDSIVLQLVSKLEDGEYMSFGLSGLEEKSRMIGGDVVVAWVDKETLKGYTDDYFLDAKSQCAGNRGSCPDKNLREGTSSVRLLNAAMVNGYSIVTYQRPLRAQDELDKQVFTNGSQAVIWAIGPLNSKNEVSYHSLANRNNVMLDFGRSPKWNCPLPESSKPEETEDAISSMTSSLPSKAKVEKLDAVDKKTTILSSNQEASPATAASVQRRPPATPAPVTNRNAWEIPPIQCNEPEDGVFYAQMGPTGGKRGYPAITGHVGWGISWYINGLLIPEINVVRGKTYTFVVEGGLDADTPARYHPFYITDDPVGGYEHKTPEERNEVRVFAGVKQNRRGDVYPSGTGRLCNWTPDQNQPLADEFASFGAYQRTLTLECDEGEPGVVQWTPDDNTPDTVYYQCYTHRYLGWKINVLDNCDVTDAAASEQVVSVVTPDADDLADADDGDELQSRPSIQVNYRVKPNDVFNKGVDEYKGDKQYASKPHTKMPENHRPEYTTYTFSHPSDAVDEPYGQEAVVNAQQYNSYNYHEEAVEEAYVPPPALPKDSYNPQYSLQHQEYINETKSDEIKANQEAQETKPHVYEVAVEAKPELKPSYPLKTLPYHPPMRTHYPMSVMTHGRVPMHGLHPMAFTRGPHFTSYRRPVPVNAYPPRPVYRPSYSPMSHQKLAMSTKKPVYRLPAQVPQMSQHRPMIIPFHRPMMYQQNPHFTTRMPQRIIPLQHSAPSKVYGKVPQLLKAEKPTPVHHVVENKESSAGAMHPSTLISTNRPSAKGGDYAAAVNTGFKPETVIVEGGFRPIVASSKDVAQDRSSQVDDEPEFAEQEVRVGEAERQPSYDEDLGRDADPFENLQHEMFEPMFIPSPPDRMGAKNKAKLSISDDLTPPELKTYNRKSSSSSPMSRVRPGLVRRPFYPDNIVPPFRIPSRGGQPSSRAAADDADEEEAAAAERRDTYYLPPGDADAVVAFDGAAVNDANLPAVGGERRATQSAEELVRGTPQFGPFRGEAPPPVPDAVGLLTQDVGRRAPAYEFPNPPPIRSTHLALVSRLEGDDGDVELAEEASEAKEAITERPAEGQASEMTTTEVGEEKARNKRAADHEPGHVGPHDHSHHEHEHHEHASASGVGRVAALSMLAAVFNVAVVLFL